MITTAVSQKIKTKNKDIDTLVRHKIIEVFREILTDPDYGLKLKPDFVKRLQKSIRAEKKGKLISLDKILKKYNF